MQVQKAIEEIRKTKTPDELSRTVTWCENRERLTRPRWTLADWEDFGNAQAEAAERVYGFARVP